MLHDNNYVTNKKNNKISGSTETEEKHSSSKQRLLKQAEFLTSS